MNMDAPGSRVQVWVQLDVPAVTGDAPHTTTATSSSNSSSNCGRGSSSSGSSGSNVGNGTRGGPRTSRLRTRSGDGESTSHSARSVEMFVSYMVASLVVVYAAYLVHSLTP